MEETQVAASLAHMLVPPTSASLRPAFLAALRAAYHGADVVAALSSRGVIANVRVLPVQEAALEATHVADRAKKGLRVCGLPSCGRREARARDRLLLRANRSSEIQRLTPASDARSTCLISSSARYVDRPCIAPRNIPRSTGRFIASHAKPKRRRREGNLPIAQFIEV